MNFAQAYFTRLDAEGPNADFVQSYSARLTYGLADRLGRLEAFPDTETPYAADAPMPTLKQIVPEPQAKLDELANLYVSVAAGIINKSTRRVTKTQMRVRDRMKLFTLITENALRLPAKPDATVLSAYPDVAAFAKSIKDYEATFPIHPALVVGPGFNIADSIHHPYHGAHHVTWSLQDNPFAFKVAELYENVVRQIVLGNEASSQEFRDLLQDVLTDATNDFQADAQAVMQAWASDPEFSFAPIVRLYVAYKESPAPLSNSLQVFNARITAALVTSLA